MLVWLKRKLRLIYRRLILGWHVIECVTENYKRWPVIDRDNNLIFINRYNKSADEADTYIEFYDPSEGTYLHSELTIPNLVKSFSRFAVSDEQVEMQGIFRKFGIRFSTTKRTVTKLKYHYERTKSGKRKRVYEPDVTIDDGTGRIPPC